MAYIYIYVNFTKYINIYGILTRLHGPTAMQYSPSDIQHKTTVSLE